MSQYTTSLVPIQTMTSLEVKGQGNSDVMLFWFKTINLAVICELIDIFGAMTNIVNLIVFTKMGFQESINVSLLCLSISDLGCLVTLAWQNLCLNPLFQELDKPFDSREVQFLTGGWPHITFARATSCITAFITLERCLCVTMPMKIRHLCTPRRVAFIDGGIFVFAILSVFPVYYSHRLGPKFYPARNQTLVGLVFTENKAQMEGITHITGLLIPFSTFLIVVICTVTLVVNLRMKTKWRQQSLSSKQSSQFSERDQKVAKMVIMVSCLFIGCFFPLTVMLLASVIDPKLSVYGNTFAIVASFGFILKSVNSSLNIFFYYSMSSKYKAILEPWLRRCQPKA